MFARPPGRVIGVPVLDQNSRKLLGWSGKGDPQGIFKRLKFDHADKMYLNQSESIQENSHKILCELGIQTDHSISAEDQNLVLIN